MKYHSGTVRRRLTSIAGSHVMELSPQPPLTTIYPTTHVGLLAVVAGDS